MGRIILLDQLQSLLLLAAFLALGAVACSDSEDSGPAAATPTPPGAVAGDPVAVVSIADATVEVGGMVTVDLVVTPQEGVTVGALDVDIVYNSAVLEATACTPAGCNATFAPDTVHFSMASLEGFSGAIGSATFTAKGDVGASAVLEVRVLSCANLEAQLIACAASNGQVTIGPQ